MHIISGKYRGRKLQTPQDEATRPSTGQVREALFNICQTYIDESDFLDLFAGSGAIGLEALSRGASSATFVDNHRESLRCIQQNIEHIGAKPKEAQALYGDVFAVMDKLARQGNTYAIIYADPPYHTIHVVKGIEDSYSNHVIKHVDEGSLLLPNGVLFIEDDGEAPEYSRPLKTLELKSSRRMGRSMLKQYIKREKHEENAINGDL